MRPKFKVMSLALAVFSSKIFAVQTCRLVPEQTVRFKNRADILFPVVDEAQFKDRDFVIEQFIKSDSPWRDRMYVIRDSVGGLHLANGDSIDSGALKRTMQSLSEKFCPEGQGDAVNTLVRKYEIEKYKKMNDAMKAMRKSNSLPEDKILCQPAREERVSLNDKVFAQMSGKAKSPPPSPPMPGSPYIPYMGQTYGMGFPSANLQMSFGLRTNTFKLLGQVLKKSDAPKSFQNIQYRPGEERRWQLAEEGMYLVRDEQGRMHAIHPEDLSPASLSKLKSGLFKCEEPNGANLDEESAGRIIDPETLRDGKPPATTAH